MRFGRQRARRWTAIVFGSWLALMGVQAEELKIAARLIWGTNDEHHKDPKCPPVDEATSKKLANVFKWKHYFLCTNVTATIPSRGTNSLVLSKSCRLEIAELEGPKVAVVLYGEGNKVTTSTKELSKGGHFVLAGPDKNGTAWFVMVNQY